MPPDDCIAALVKLGFTPVEAEVYAFLVQASPATGYRIAQALCKPAANVYKAIEALENKGAILVDDGANRLCRALPPEQLLGQLDRAFQEKRRGAAEALAALRVSQSDDRVYQLRSRDQVFERCRDMLSRARRLALLDIFPGPLAELQPDIEAAAARGVDVTLKAFRPAAVAGTQVVLNPRGAEVMAQYPGHWLILIVDGAEMLVASLDANGRDVQQAIWSSSVTLSWIFHCSFAAEIMLSVLLLHIDEGAAAEDLRAAVAPLLHPAAGAQAGTSAVEAAIRRCRSYYGSGVPGYDILLARFGSHQGEDSQ